MTVNNATGDHFRYIDCTAMAEALYSFLNETIEKELPGELAFLQFYDRAREAMRDVVDLPEITANLFLRLVHQNGGRLSKAKARADGVRQAHRSGNHRAGSCYRQRARRKRCRASVREFRFRILLFLKLFLEPAKGSIACLLPRFGPPR